MVVSEHNKTVSGRGRAGQGRAGQGRAGQGRAEQGRISIVSSCRDTRTHLKSVLTAHMSPLNCQNRLYKPLDPPLPGRVFSGSV